MGENPSSYLPYGEFLEKSRKKQLRPGLWKWRDMEPQLRVSQAKDDFLGVGRGAVSFVHDDIGTGYGVCSSLNMLVQSFAPGAGTHSHRHSNFAIFIVKKGCGYSMIDDQKVEWEEGDVFFAPPWARHYHKNSSASTEAVLFTVQNVPAVTDMGLWLFKGSDEDAEIQHSFADERTL